VRTTVTLDDDVVAALREESRRTGASFEQVLDEAVRRGLGAPPATQPYVVPVADLGIRADVDIDTALALAAALEDDAILGKLALGN
jgi:hypothetical protein